MGLTSGPTKPRKTGTLVMSTEEAAAEPAPPKPAAKKRVTSTLVMTPEDHAASPPPVGVTAAQPAAPCDEGLEGDVDAGAFDDDWDEDEPPTQRRNPPRARFTLPPEPPDASEDDEDASAPSGEGHIDDDTLPRPRRDKVVLVNGAATKERVEAEIQRITDKYLFVSTDGTSRRISRSAGFEHPPGGSWSTWRLCGRDRRRWAPDKD